MFRKTMQLLIIPAGLILPRAARAFLDSELQAVMISQSQAMDILRCCCFPCLRTAGSGALQPSCSGSGK